LILFFLLLLVVAIAFWWKKGIWKSSPSIIYEPIGFQKEEEELKQKIESLGEGITGDFILKDDYWQATLTSGTTLLVKKGQDQSLLLASLQLIFKNIRIEGKWPLIIDLRFSRPILKY